jgi:hypothetical protein
MNERINGLWWKARIGYNEQNCDPEVLAKFAELIVRECVGCLSQEHENYRLLGSDYCDNMADGLGEAIELIKEHFGVEE